MAADEGFIKVISSIIANNGNPKLWTVQNSEVKGASQNFATIQDLVDFHPNKMRRGMRGTVQDFPTAGKSTDFKLVTDPALLVDTNEDSIVTLDNYASYWQELETTTPASIRVYNYAPDGPGGGAPVYPYTVGEEPNWSPEFDAQKNHRWLRFRDDDVDDNTDGVFDNWTVPISLNSFQSGDYVENRFQRYALSKPNQDLTTSGDLENGRFYVINTESLTVDGVVFQTGKRFTFTGQTITFNNGAIVRETNIPPARTNAQGQPNNEPVGWEDTPPAGTDTLWMITGQKSVYGQLKSEWVIRKIDEQPDLVRYSYSAEPNPNTLCTTTESAADGQPADTALIAGGWIKTYTDQTFMAYRSDLGGGTWTAWQIEKIAGESGEYIDNVFKLYPINTDPDSPSVQAPTTRTPENEGWADSPLVEGPTDINFISTARKFFDGTLKSTWSAPVPYTGKSTYQDVIVSDPGDEFKIDPNTIPAVIVPSLITLEQQLFKGADKVWEQAGVTMTFKWYRVYNDGTVYAADASSEPTAISGFTYLTTTGTPGTSGYKFDNQRVTIDPTVVTGKAVFRCVATLQTGGDDIVFEEEISILDISDGLDAKNLSVTADNQLLIYDTSNTVFVPANIVLRAYYSNLGSPTLFWYHYTGGVWSALVSAQNTYSALASAYFTADGSAEEARFAVSTHPTDPDLADGITYFTDTITIGKTSAAGIGSPGENSVIALLDNETHTTVVDNTTGQPFAGEIGSSGKAITKVEVWDGTTKLSIGDSGQDVDMTIASDNANITFGKQYGTQGVDAEKYAEVYVDTWVANEISAVCTITLVYSGKTYEKKFSVSSTQDAPGAILLDIDSTGGFEWTPSDRTDKTVNGNLYDTNILQTSGYVYRWLINGIATSLPNLGTPTASFSADNREVTLARTLVTGSAEITCQAYPSGSTPQTPIENTAGFRSRTVRFTDVLDNQSKIAWTDAAVVDNSHKIVDGTAPSSLPVTVNTVTWRLSTDAHWSSNTPTFASVAEETSTGWVWTYPYQITGEKGDQGPNGDYFFNMYKASGTTLPAVDADMATMRANGWTRLPPTTGIVYVTLGRFNGETNPPQGDGYPPNAAVPEDNWSTPAQITGNNGTDGTDGDPGTDGDQGWSPVFAVVSDGNTREVLQLVDWIGGSGTKPGNIGQYVSSSGFTGTIGSAQSIKGSSIKVQVGGSTWTQGTPSDGDLWINRVI